MNRKYFEQNEENDYEIMKDFNQKLNLSDLGQTPSKWNYDASGITQTGEIVSIELKKRNMIVVDNQTISGKSASTEKGYVDSTIMIEPHKLAELALEYVLYNRIPLYINILNGGKEIVVFNIRKLLKTPEYSTRHTNIYSKGYDRKETNGRFYLDIKDAYIYIKTDNGWERMKSN